MGSRLLHQFFLCNDINVKTLLSIVDYDEDHLLVTCKSFIKRFNINANDKKQVNSWLTSSWHVFTSGALKDPKSERICVIINGSSFCMWDISEKDIKNAKMRMFNSELKALASGGENLFIIYKCGFVEYLESGLKRRKETKNQVLRKEEEILQHKVFEDKKLAAFLVQNKEEEIHFYKQTIGSYSEPIRVKIKLPGFDMTGSALFSSGELFTTWSDGNLYSSRIPDLTTSTGPGALKGRISGVIVKKKMRILELASNHLVLHGMKACAEGGMVQLWDTKFGVSVASKSLKMYSNPPLGWSISSGVVVVDGNYLVYIPVSLTQSSVASMLGSRIGVDGEINTKTPLFPLSNNYAELNEPKRISECLNWSTVSRKHNLEIPFSATQTIASDKSFELGILISQLNLRSASENIVAERVIEKLIEKRNVKLLIECFSAFSYIPEKGLVNLLKFFIELPDEEFKWSETKSVSPSKLKNKKKQRSTSISKMDKIPNGILDSNDSISQHKNQTQTMDNHEGKVSPFSTVKSSVLSEVLVKPFSHKELSIALKKLDFKNSLLLMDHLHYLLASGTAQVLKEAGRKVPTIDIASTWLSLLLDTNYHQLVMTSEIPIQRKLLNCFTDITNLMESLEASYGIDALVERVLLTRGMPGTRIERPYTIERIQIL